MHTEAPTSVMDRPLAEPLRILVVTRGARCRGELADALDALGHEVILACSGSGAVDDSESLEDVDLVLAERSAPGAADGPDVLGALKRRDPDLPVVLSIPRDEPGAAARSLREGADDVLELPVTPEALEACLLRVGRLARLLRETRFLRRRSALAPDLLIHSEPMQTLLEAVERVAPSSATVLLRGERGVGKQRIAAEIHRRSARFEGAMVRVETAASPEELLTSELFGHEAGAADGPVHRVTGCIEGADGGTLFLDEVAGLGPSLQARLLRLLQHGELVRVGGSRPVRVDVRVVVATRRDLAELVREGHFRQDLYDCLSVVPLEVLPLRERPEDIAPLAESLLPAGMQLEPEALDLLRQHDWPGNVRELQAFLRQVSDRANAGSLGVEDVRGALGERSAADRSIDPDPTGQLVGRPLRDVEDALIQATLADCDGNRTRAAKVLGIGVRTLFNRLRALEEAGSSPAGSATR